MKKLCINNKFIKTVVITIIAIICFGAAFSAADKIAVSAYAAPQIDAFFAGSAITSDGNTTIVASNHYYIEWNDLELVYDGNGKTPTAALKCVEDPDFSVTGSISLLNSEDGGDNAGEGEQTQEPTEGGEQTDGTVDSGSSGSPTEGTAENVESNEQTEGTTDSADGNSQTDSVTSEMIDAGTYMVQVEFEGLTLAPEIDASKEFTILPCTVEVKWSAGDGAAEDPTGIFNYTYNGQAQGPEAYYMSVNNESVQIVDVSGLEENAKNSAYTAYVDANAAGGNYTLTNTTCPYTISPFSVAVQWKAYATEEGFIIDGSVPEYEYNGYLQGPVAYYTSVSNVLIPIAVNGHEINANTSDLTYTASIDRSSIDSNYTLNADAVEEYTYKITPKATAVIWIAAESYTYDGEAQGPTATYETVNGEALSLPVNGLGANAGSYTASVAEDAVGENYVLNDTTFLYTISPCSVAVQWKAYATEEGFIIDGSVPEYEYNGYLQGPVAYYTSVSNVLIPIAVNGHEINANTSDLTYTASIDRSSIDSNYTLNANAVEEYTYKIIPKATAVIWNAAESYTYDGEAQGPTATYETVNGEVLNLLVTGLGINAGSHIASVAEDAAGGNYTLTGLECGYEIAKYVASVVWQGGSCTYNGEAQGPGASFKNVYGDIIYLTVSGLGTDAGRYTAQVAECAAGENYILTNLEYGYEIAKAVASVIWQGGSYTYNGEAQGPGASFNNVHGDIIYLTVSGLGTDVGRYTAQVAEYAAGRNYILTNLEYDYEIAKAVVNVTWSVADYYINNDEVQGPHAYIVNESGEMIELSILNLGTESGEYVAEIDLSSVNPNFELSGELQKSYEIIPETAFGNGGIALSVVLGAILLVIVILAIYFYIRRKNTVLTMPTGDSYSEVYEDKDIAPDVRTDKLKERNKQLKAYIRQLEHEISNIRKSNQKYDSENIKLQEEMENLNITHHKELGKLNDKYNMLTKELESVKAQHASKIMRMEEERANLNTAHNKEIDKLNTICASQKQQLEGAKQENDSQRRQFTDKINSLTGKYDAEIDRLSKDNLSLRKQQEKDKKEFETIKQDFERISREARARAEEDSQKIAMLDKDIALKKEALSNKEDALHEASEELRELKERIAKNPNFYKHPIEEYFDDIDKAYETAQACDFDINNPLYCYSSQREALDKIMGLIAIYRSQKR